MRRIACATWPIFSSSLPICKWFFGRPAVRQSALECGDEIPVFQPLEAKCSLAALRSQEMYPVSQPTAPSVKHDIIMAQQRNRGKKRVVFTIFYI